MPRTTEDLAGLGFDLKYGRRPPEQLTPSESAAVDLRRGAVTFDQLTDAGQAMVRADWPFLAPPPPGLMERAGAAVGGAFQAAQGAAAPVMQGVGAVGREVAESASRLPRLVTEGLPAAGRAVVESQTAPTFGQGLQAGPLGFTPIPGALDLAERGMRLLFSPSVAARELGPEKAKPLTEALTAGALGLGPAGVRALATDIRGLRTPQFRLPEMTPAPREALVRGFQEPPPILPSRGIPSETELIVPKRPVSPETPIPSQADVAAKRAGIDPTIPEMRPSAILDPQGRPIQVPTARARQTLQQQFEEAKGRAGAMPQPPSALPRVQPREPPPRALPGSVALAEGKGALVVPGRAEPPPPPAAPAPLVPPGPVKPPPTGLPPLPTMRPPAPSGTRQVTPAPLVPRGQFFGSTIEPGTVTLSDPEEVRILISGFGGISRKGLDIEAVPKSLLAREGGVQWDELINEIATAQSRRPNDVERDLARTLGRFETLRGELKTSGILPEIRAAQPPSDVPLALEEWRGMGPGERRATIQFFRAEAEDISGGGDAFRGLLPPIPLPGPEEGQEGTPEGIMQRAAQIAGLSLPLLGLAGLRWRISGSKRALNAFKSEGDRFVVEQVAPDKWRVADTTTKERAVVPTFHEARRWAEQRAVPTQPAPPPGFEQTPIGLQALVPGTPGRTMPTGKVATERPQRPVTDLPLLRADVERQTRDAQANLFGESGAFIPGARFSRRLPPPNATPVARAASEADVLEAFAGEPPGRMTKVGDVLGRNLVPNYKWNEEAIAIFRERRGRQAFLAEESRAGQREMLKQQEASGLGSGDLGATLKGLSDNPEAQAIIQPWRARIDRNAQELAGRGLLNPETAQANLGRYARRVYLRDILGRDYVPPPQAVEQARVYLRQNLEISGRPATGAEIEGVMRRILQSKSTTVLSLRGRPRIPLDPVKRRKDIPVEIRQLMGEVEDGSYLAARTVLDQESMLINDDFFRLFRQGTEPMTVAGERVQMPWVRGTPAPGYRQIPDAKPYGALRNAYVLDKYADEIVAMGRGETGNALLETYFDYTNLFKISKTALNPATHARNIVSNFAFADFAGVAPWQPGSARFYRRSFAELRQGPKSPVMREAIEHGAIGAEMVGPDIQRLGHVLQDTAAHRGVFGTLRDLGSHGIDRVGRLYNQEDQIFKLASYIRQRSLGMSPREASAHVNTWFPNYAEVAPAIRNLRGSERTVGGSVAAAVGNPFASFKAEAIRIAVNAANPRTGHPVKLAKWLAAPMALTYAGMAAMGVSPEDARRAFRTLPDFMQQPFTVLLPWRDASGSLQFWDMTYFHFLGDIIAANPRTPTQREFLGPDNPLTATGGALATSFLGGSPFVVGAMQILHNRDLFTGQEAVRFPITTPEGLEGLARSIGEDVLPVPPFLTRGVESVRRAAEGLPGRFGERISVPTAATETLTGFRAIGTGPDIRRRQAITLRGRVNELQREMFRSAANPDRPRARKDVEALRRKLEAVLQQFSGPTVAERTAIPLP